MSGENDQTVARDLAIESLVGIISEHVGEDAAAIARIDAALQNLLGAKPPTESPADLKAAMTRIEASLKAIQAAIPKPTKPAPPRPALELEIIPIRDSVGNVLKYSMKEKGT